MKTKLLSNGRIEVFEPSGIVREIGPESPEYSALRKQYDTPAGPNPLRTRLLGIVAIIGGMVAWWYNWHEVTAEGVRPTFGILCILGGLLMIWRPEWTGPIRANSTSAHKTGLLVLIVLALALTGIDYYYLTNYKH